MDLEPRHDDQAALERLKQVQNLSRRDSADEMGVNQHSLAYYAAGVAVECLLRAFSTRQRREFEGRHDLIVLFQESGLLDLSVRSKQPPSLSDADPRSLKSELGGAIARVNRMWMNNLR